jgi:hypothetical protein
MHRDFGDLRVLLDRDLDLDGGHVLAAPADRVLLAVDERDETVGVDAALVAGVVPEVAPRFDRRVGLAPEAEVHAERFPRPDDDLADLAGCDLAVVVVY